MWLLPFSRCPAAPHLSSLTWHYAVGILQTEVVVNLSQFKWRLASRTLWLLLTSHSSLLLRLMEPPVRPPRLRCALFPSMYLPHLLVLPATFGLQCLLPPYPYFRALYAVPVRQVRDLPTASFRFRLAADTLAVQLCASSLPTRTRDLHPLENAHAGQTKCVLPYKAVRISPHLIKSILFLFTVQPQRMQELHFLSYLLQHGRLLLL